MSFFKRKRKEAPMIFGQEEKKQSKNAKATDQRDRKQQKNYRYKLSTKISSGQKEVNLKKANEKNPNKK
jgi:hypothetical protein